MTTKRQALENYLLKVFSDDSFERWVAHTYPEISSEIPWRKSLAEVVFRVVEQLGNRGLIDAQFFERLTEARPARNNEIKTLAALYVGPSDASAGPDASPAPVEGERAAYAWDVFVSYAPDDRELVYDLALQLHDNDLRVFFDEWAVGPGVVRPRVIEQGLTTSMHGIVAVGPDTQLQDWARTQYEALLERAVANQQLLLIPVLLGTGTVELPLFLRLRKAVDLRNKHGDAFRAGVALIVRALKGLPPGP